MREIAVDADSDESFNFRCMISSHLSSVSVGEGTFCFDSQNLNFSNNDFSLDLTVFRKNLRSFVEYRELSIHKTLLQSFSDINSELESIEKQVNEMRSSCAAMESKLSLTKEVCGKLMLQTDSLNSQDANLEKRIEFVEKFLHRFQLSEDDIEILKSVEMNQSFFSAFQRVQDISFGLQSSPENSASKARAGNHGLNVSASGSRIQEAVQMGQVRVLPRTVQDRISGNTSVDSRSICMFG